MRFDCLYCDWNTRQLKKAFAHWINHIAAGGKHERSATEATATHQGALPPQR